MKCIECGKEIKDDEEDFAIQEAGGSWYHEECWWVHCGKEAEE